MANNNVTHSAESLTILNAFKQKFSTTINSIYINSLQREVKFREVSVNEQKTLSKTLIENENRKDITYDTQCALINRICLENDQNSLRKQAIDAGLTPASKDYQEFINSKRFDVYNLTEFDRIRILIEIYQSNYFKNEITYKCKECGMENKYTLDFSKIIERLNEFDLKDVIFTAEDRDRNYKFILNYPLVRTISGFYKSYNSKYKGVTDKERETLDNLSNVDYIMLYIKGVEISDKDNPEEVEKADLTCLTYSELSELIAMFPQNIIFSESSGVFTFISKEFIEKINNVFAYERCKNCGAQTSEGLGSAIDFF